MSDNNKTYVSSNEQLTDAASTKNISKKKSVEGK